MGNEEAMRCRLANGMELVTCSRDGANVVSIQCVVWAGSLDETIQERGVAHFLEHMLFKGTKTRGVGQIPVEIEKAGGDINAYTTFDKTVFHLTVPSTSATLGFDVLSDAIFESALDSVEFEKEREVILEEIRRGNDDPGVEVGRKIFSELYEGSEAERPVIGYAEEVERFTRQTLVEFWQRLYQPQNMSLLVVGNLSTIEAKKLADTYFGSRQSTRAVTKAGGGRHRDLCRKTNGGVRSIVIAGDYEQSRLHVVLGAPNIDSPDCPLIDTAAYVIGGSDVSRLQRRLKEKEAVVNAIGASAYTPVFEGIFEVSAALDPSNFESACSLIARELASISCNDPVKKQEVDRARAASRIARIHREETVDGVASALVSGLSTPIKEKFENYYDYLLESLEPEDVTEALQRFWSFDDVLIVALCDKARAPMSADLTKAFAQGLSDARNLSLKSEGLSKPSKPTTKVHRFNIGEAVSVIYREVPSTRMFSLTAATEGGQRGESLENAGTFHAMATLIGLASRQKNYEQFAGRIEDLGAVLSGFSGKDSFGLEMHCTSEQVEEMIDLMAENMLAPVFPEAQWEVYSRETLETLKMQLDSAPWICMRRLNLQVYGNHPYALPITGFEKNVKSFSASTLQKKYETWRDDGRWVFGVVGGVSPDLVQKKLNQVFGSFKPSPNLRDLTKVLSESEAAPLFPDKPKRQQEQAHLVVGGAGPTWMSPGREAVDIIINILGGHGGRLFTTLRDEESLAYSVSPLHSQGLAGGMVGAYIATATNKVARARSGLERELHKISSRGPTLEEIERAKSYILGSHEISLQRTSSQAMTMALMELYQLGWDDFLNYPNRLRQVSESELHAAAAHYFDPSRLKDVTVGG